MLECEDVGGVRGRVAELDRFLRGEQRSAPVISLVDEAGLTVSRV